ncbi:hypothetical protein MUK42_14298 [Musa troglodytarum]|uniref:C2 domain-containing protein n=1 Tax=Musa troglodytarum TaxID=320322 RepID=A0A9E7IGB2_9LILI|nr:hypothetical protein MUK42_14298 [Musa troglodytarum]
MTSWLMLDAILPSFLPTRDAILIGFPALKEEMKLAVEVVRAHRLKPRDRHGTTNPFVEVEFDGQSRRTATKLNDLNPSWSETLVFDVSDPLDLPDRTVDVAVFHERLSSSVDHCRRRRSFLGHVRLLGSSVASSRLDAVLQLYPLNKRSLFFNVRGEIGLRLYAVPEAYEAQAADGHLPLSSASAPTVSIPSTISAAETLPPKSTMSVGEMLPPKKKSHQFHSVGTASATGKSQSYYRANHDRAGPAVAASVQQAPPPKIEYAPPPKIEYRIVETQPPLAALMGYRLARNSDKIKSTYDLVEQMEFLFVRIVRARNLPAMDIAGSLDPYVVVKLGNFINKTNHREQNRDPEWENVFAFSKGHIQAQRLEVVVKDKNFIKDDIVGDVAIDLPEVPLRAPPDGPVAPQWYRLRKGINRDDDAYRGEIMMAVWMGTQADEVYPDALHSDAHLLPLASIPHTRSKVYFSPRMSYLRVNVISAQDLKPSRPDPAIYVKVHLGAQMRWTLVSSDRSPNPTWKNEELMLVACEPFDHPLVLMVQDRLLPNKDETLAKLEIRKGAIRTRADHHKPFAPQWFNLDNPNGSSGNGSGYGKLQLRVYYDNNYHVIDESAPFCSDFQPSAKPLRKPNIGLLELGILNARDLAPLRSNNGGGKRVDAYCVAKYGPKWVRTRTILGTAEPQWNEQYLWGVHDPCTVLTVAVFNNGHVDGNNDAAKDDPVGKIRIRLSTLEIDRVYTHFYPLLVVHPSGLKKTGELHLALRFTCTSWLNMLFLYVKPPYPKMHYKQPIPFKQMQYLRYQAKQTVAAKLARAEPPLGRDVVAYILDDASNTFSLRKGKTNWLRIRMLFSDVQTYLKWFDAVRSWARPAVTTLVLLLFCVVAWTPSLILPSVFLHLFIVGAWNSRRRPRHPPHVDTNLSLAESAVPDELDEELDSYPSTRTNEMVMSRYDRLRVVASRVQSVVADLATHAERIQALLSWRDPRATAIFVVFAIIMAAVFYFLPFQLVVMLLGLYFMRHPKFRSKTPSAAYNFFRRLPSNADTFLVVCPGEDEESGAGFCFRAHFDRLAYRPTPKVKAEGKRRANKRRRVARRAVRTLVFDMMQPLVVPNPSPCASSSAVAAFLPFRPLCSKGFQSSMNHSGLLCELQESAFRGTRIPIETRGFRSQRASYFRSITRSRRPPGEPFDCFPC